VEGEIKMKALIQFLIVVLLGGVFWQTAQAQQLSACEQLQFGNTGGCEDEGIVSVSPEAEIISNSPEQAQTAGFFGNGQCLTGFGYVSMGARLCMTGTRGPATFANADLDCKDIFGRVADYGDWRYRIFRGDGLPAPVGFWLGPITADNTALFVNLPNIADFDGEASRFDSRSYVCAHDK
jgi:hypothetical protein